MATKEQLNGSIEAFREHRERLIKRVALVDNIIAEIEMMLGDGDETFKGEYSPTTAALDAIVQTPSPNGKQRLSKADLFGKSISEATIEVLRASPQPMGAKEIVQALENAGYQFGAGDHYFGVYRALQPDRRPTTIIKQGKLYGIKRDPKRGTLEPPEEGKGEAE